MVDLGVERKPQGGSVKKALDAKLSSGGPVRLTLSWSEARGISNKNSLCRDPDRHLCDHPRYYARRKVTNKLYPGRGALAAKLGWCSQFKVNSSWPVIRHHQARGVTEPQELSAQPLVSSAINTGPGTATVRAAREEGLCPCGVVSISQEFWICTSDRIPSPKWPLGGCVMAAMVTSLPG